MRLAVLQVRARRVADVLTPIEAFARLVAPGEPGFILESVDQQGRWSRYSVIGRRPLARIVGSVGHAALYDHEGAVCDTSAGILEGLARWHGALGILTPPETPELPGPFSVAWVGHVGYGAAREREPSVPSRHPDDVGIPEARLMLPGDLVVFDHWSQSLTLASSVLAADGTVEDAFEALERLRDDLHRPSPGLVRPIEWPTLGSDAEELPGREHFERRYDAMVRAAHDAIRNGEVFQVVLSHRFELSLAASPLALYRALRLTNPSPYMYLVQDADASIVGSSPEALATVRGGLVQTHPIAGSRPRGRDADEDERLVAELLADPKERAEHLMLVDLARNDVGRIARLGSVTVDEFMVPERFARVIHLSSSVRGVLREGLGPIDALAATLPAGTLSGAPKVRAMQLIDELEASRRVVYGGVVGYVGLDASVSSSSVMDFAIAIRTAVWLSPGRVLLQAGAGIVAGSDPAREAAECLTKAAAVARALQMAPALDPWAPAI